MAKKLKYGVWERGDYKIIYHKDIAIRPTVAVRDYFTFELIDGVPVVAPTTKRAVRLVWYEDTSKEPIKVKNVYGYDIKYWIYEGKCNDFDNFFAGALIETGLYDTIFIEVEEGDETHLYVIDNFNEVKWYPFSKQIYNKLKSLIEEKDIGANE